MRSHRNRVLMLMASYAALCFTRLQGRPATHGLHHPVILIQRLEIQRSAARHFEEGRTVRLHVDRAEYPLYVPAGISHTYRREGMAAAPCIEAVSGTDTGHAVDRLYNTQLLDRSRFDTFQAVSFVNVLHIVNAFLFRIVHIIYTLERTFAFGQQDRLIAGDACIRNQQFTLAGRSHPVDTELHRGAYMVTERGIRDQELVFIQGVRMLELVAELSVGIYFDGFRPVKRSNQHDTFVLVASRFRVDDT